MLPILFVYTVRIRRLVMLTAYLDESEHTKQRILCVGGWVMDGRDAESFERKWQKTLDRANVQDFQMADFENRRGPYANWRNGFRFQVQNQLLAILRTHARRWLGTALDLDAFDRLTADERSLIGNETAYAFCVRTCLDTMVQWLDDTGQTEPVAYVLDAFQNPTLGKGALEVAFKELARGPNAGHYRIDTIAWRKASATPELKGADIPAYEIAKELMYPLGRSIREPRKSLLALWSASTLPEIGVLLIDDDALRDILANASRQS